VNRRTRRTRELSSSLQQARDELAQTALAITEAIPVGTYTMVLRPEADLAEFSFMSERFLQICGLERQAAQANPLNAFACVHPDDYDDWLALNALRPLPRSCASRGSAACWWTARCAGSWPNRCPGIWPTAPPCGRG
jgi:hypothetical protein